MSKQRALNPQTKQSTPPKSPRQEPSHLQALESSVLDDRWMSKQRALSPKQNTNSPEATEAGAEPLQALESSVRMTDG